MTVGRRYKLYPDSLGIQRFSRSTRHFTSSKTTSPSMGCMGQQSQRHSLHERHGTHWKSETCTRPLQSTHVHIWAEQARLAVRPKISLHTLEDISAVLEARACRIKCYGSMWLDLGRGPPYFRVIRCNDHVVRECLVSFIIVSATWIWLS
jgi:hypothetical protein